MATSNATLLSSHHLVNIIKEKLHTHSTHTSTVMLAAAILSVVSLASMVLATPTWPHQHSNDHRSLERRVEEFSIKLVTKEGAQWDKYFWMGGKDDCPIETKINSKWLILPENMPAAEVYPYPDKMSGCSIRPNPTLVDRARAVASTVGWRGLSLSPEDVVADISCFPVYTGGQPGNVRYTGECKSVTMPYGENCPTDCGCPGTPGATWTETTAEIQCTWNTTNTAPPPPRI